MDRAAEPSLSFTAPAARYPIRIRLARPLDDDALYELCRMNRDLRIERTAEGELIIMPPTGSQTGHRNLRLLVDVGTWAERDGSGVAFDSSTGFVLPNGAERSPDAAWIRRERWEALTDEQRRKFAPLCPDFVIELASPSDEPDELNVKMNEWIENGARLGWLIDPDGRTAFAYRPGREREALGWPDELSGDPELPGLRVDLRRLG